MDECSKCKYRKPCENLNYLDVANTCSDLRKFVDEIRADVINEYFNKFDEWIKSDSKLSYFWTEFQVESRRIAEELKEQK